MVHIPPPPPARPPNPLFAIIHSGAFLVRLFDPSRFGTTALSFRRFGPLLRFDHHGPAGLSPGPDPARGIYYVAQTLSGCLVEVFGDTGLIITGDWHGARPQLTRDLRLLDLRGSGALRAGSVSALSKVPDHGLAQAWSRHFYESGEYRTCDGVLYYNAHNDEEAIALYERAEAALICPASAVLRLDDPALRPELLRLAQDNHLVCAP